MPSHESGTPLIASAGSRRLLHASVLRGLKRAGERAWHLPAYWPAIWCLVRPG